MAESLSDVLNNKNTIKYSAICSKISTHRKFYNKKRHSIAMVFRQKRGDTRIGNIDDLPRKVTEKYRSDATLDHVLDRERVVSKNQLKKKYSDN